MVLYGEYITKFNGSNFAIKEPLVRCRDCKYCAHDMFGYWCIRNEYREFEIGKEPDCFCAWGERREP